MTTSVTVVVITHNRRDELRRTLRAMAALPDAAPIIVADNDSTDGSADMVQSEFPAVTVVRLSENLGATARNIAVERVATRYVAFCDDDTVWQPGALTTAAAVLDRCPGLATVTGRCLVWPSLREDPLTPELRHSPVAGPEWMPGPTLLGIMAGLTMIRCSAFRQVGGFEPRMWLGGEEELLALDLAAAGWWMCWREDVVVHHAPSPARDARRLGNWAYATPCGRCGCGGPSGPPSPVRTDSAILPRRQIHGAGCTGGGSGERLGGAQPERGPSVGGAGTTGTRGLPGPLAGAQVRGLTSGSSRHIGTER